LWIETLRQAAGADRAATRALVEKLRAQFDQLPADASMVDLARLELESRSEIFRLIEGEYIEVFFRINSAFSRQQVEAQLGDMKGVRLHHPVFLERWRKAKLMELEAIAEGDEMLAMMTGLHTRKVWISRSSEDGQG
jgi:GntR family transcriptional regulator, transcriptional repressor for pyruvate dehydrogenase complex